MTTRLTLSAGNPEPATAPEVLDMTPTWAAIMPALVAALQHGTPEGQRLAAAELESLAAKVDSANAKARAGAEAAPVAWRTGSDVTLNPERAENWRAMGAKVYPLFDSANAEARDGLAEACRAALIDGAAMLAAYAEGKTHNESWGQARATIREMRAAIARLSETPKN